MSVNADDVLILPDVFIVPDVVGAFRGYYQESWDFCNMMSACGDRSDDWLLDIPKVFDKPNFEDYRAYIQMGPLSIGR